MESVGLPKEAALLGLAGPLVLPQGLTKLVNPVMVYSSSSAILTISDASVLAEVKNKLGEGTISLVNTPTQGKYSQLNKE